MIVITGAAGFIGSCFVAYLNELGIDQIVISDDFTINEKQFNVDGKKYIMQVPRNRLVDWLDGNAFDVKFVFHLGARTDTTLKNAEVFHELNLNFSKSIWNLCTTHQIPLIYASSAATYGDGAFGYNDDESDIPFLKPLNLYGESKHEFDKYILTENTSPPFWCGLKFFNVYGPNEYHKNRMASVIFHAFNQINDTGKVKLFKSHHKKYLDGEQLRDFIYVMDIVKVMHWLMIAKIKNGIYNLGSGEARTFYDLAAATAQAMKKELNIVWIDIPEDIRSTYQYFTEANMQKLKHAGYPYSFYSLENGIQEYVENFLSKMKYY